jgi:hypothetical protein
MKGYGYETEEVTESTPQEPDDVHLLGPRLPVHRDFHRIPQLGDVVHYQWSRSEERPALVVWVGPGRKNGDHLPSLHAGLRVWGRTSREDFGVESCGRGKVVGSWHWPGERCQVYR